MKVPCPSRTFLRVSAIQIDSSLTPFLYATPTIQNWIAPYAPSSSRRSHGSRRHASTNRDHVPFEAPKNGGPYANVLNRENVTRSTISAREKRVFDKLLDPSHDPRAPLKMEKFTSRSRSPANRASARRSPAPQAQAPVDRKFNDADLRAKHEQLLEAKRRATALQQEKLNELRQAQQEGVHPTNWEETEALRTQREQMLALARLQFSRAKTDEDLWELLAKWTFAIIRRHLGQVPRPNPKNMTPEQMESRRQQEAVFLTHNYPQLLVAFLDELRTNFPASQLAFTVLPMVKSLGRQSYVLGASTALYNGIILDTWRTFSDFHRINELLLEMENAGLEFDYDTLDVLSKIRRQGDRILKGERGVLLKRVWELDSIVSGWTTVVGWIPKVKDRLEADALRRASESEMEEDGEEYEEGSEGSEDWDEEVLAMQEQQDALRRAAANLG